MSNNKLIILLSAALITDTGIADAGETVALSFSKSIILQCRNEALIMHPGRITDQHEFNPGRELELRFELNDNELADWVVFCDGETGRIVRHYKLSDNRH